MAVNLVTVTGNLEAISGGDLSLGRLWFRLNRPDWNLSGDIFAPEYVEAIASAGGAFSVAGGEVIRLIVQQDSAVSLNIVAGPATWCEIVAVG